MAQCLNAIGYLTLRLLEQVSSFIAHKGFEVKVTPKEEALGFGGFGLVS